jgi:hypothetical protein
MFSRRKGQRRCGARPPRVRHEILHGGGQLGPGGQQRAHLLHPGPHPLSLVHPLPEAESGHEPQGPEHGLGMGIAIFRGMGAFQSTAGQSTANGF